METKHTLYCLIYVNSLWKGKAYATYNKGGTCGSDL